VKTPINTPVAAIALIALVALLLGVSGTALVTAQVAGIEAVFVQGEIPLDPESQFWQDMGKAEIPLVAQNIVYPLTGESEARKVRVAAAVNDEGILAIYMEWDDPTVSRPSRSPVPIHKRVTTLHMHGDDRTASEHSTLEGAQQG